MQITRPINKYMLVHTSEVTHLHMNMGIKKGSHTTYLHYSVGPTCTHNYVIKVPNSVTQLPPPKNTSRILMCDKICITIRWLAVTLWVPCVRFHTFQADVFV